MIEIIPGILEKTFEAARAKLNKVRSLANWVQIDILDNTLIKNTTFNDFAPYRDYTQQFNFEAHLMVTNPTHYVKPLADAGFRRVIAQVEGTGIREFIEEAHLHDDLEVGLAIDAPSDLELIEPFLAKVDCALVMMYRMGFSGQTFQKEQLEKIVKIKEMYPELPIEVDGGIDDQTAPLVIEAGATRLVSTSFLFWKNADRIPGAIEELKANI